MRLVKIIFGATVNWIEGERRYLSFAWYFEEEDHIFYTLLIYIVKCI